MADLGQLLENNRVWTNEVYDRTRHDRATNGPGFFWIGCCDGPFDIAPRLGLASHDLFIHRNLANIVSGFDHNGLGALQYAVEALEVRHIIVCGHSRCRGVRAVMGNESLGVTDHWLSEIMDLAQRMARYTPGAVTDGYLTEVCTRNVQEQVAKLWHTRIVRDAWRRGRDLTVHGWMHDDDTGLFHALGTDVACIDRGQPQKFAGSTSGRDHEQVRRAKRDDAATA